MSSFIVGHLASFPQYNSSSSGQQKSGHSRRERETGRAGSSASSAVNHFRNLFLSVVRRIGVLDALDYFSSLDRFFDDFSVNSIGSASVSTSASSSPSAGRALRAKR
jgi:hypothetical protein